MRCPNCDHDNEDDAHYCEECGFDMSTAASTPGMTHTPSPQPSVPVAPPGTGAIPPYSGPCLEVPSTGSIFKLGDVTVIGREDPTLQIDFDGYEDGKYVSHRHAQITRAKDTFYIEDLNSSNFTRVNGKKLGQGQSEPLHEGDVIRVGKIEMTFHGARRAE